MRMSSDELSDQTDGNFSSKEDEDLQQFRNNCISTIKNWVLDEAEFYGRTDDDFLLIFLHGCKFDIEKTKKKLEMYYANRMKLSHWWSNRNLNDDSILSIAHMRISTAVAEKDPRHPTVFITKLSQLGSSSHIFDNMHKLHTSMIDVILRRQTCQLNGFVWIVDCKDYPWWIMQKLLSPVIVMNYISGYYMACPLRIKNIVILNAPSVTALIWKIAQPFVKKKIRERIYFYRSDWSPLYQHVPHEMIPDEYGGTAGPYKTHEDAFLQEVLSYADYILHDNKYGFQRDQTIL